ncbi:MAG: hypothetical protein ACKV2V_26340, partial [Blastocatellia bacterium]
LEKKVTQATGKQGAARQQTGQRGKLAGKWGQETKNQRDQVSFFLPHFPASQRSKKSRRKNKK